MSGGYSYDQTDQAGNRLKIGEGRIGEVALVEIHDQEGNTLGTLVPAGRRWFAAQAVAGDLYQVVAVPAVPEHTCVGTAALPHECAACGAPIDVTVPAGSVSVAGMANTINELISEIVGIVEYVGFDMLPAHPGWGWYDMLAKHAPDVLRKIAPKPENVILGHQRADDDGNCRCGWDRANPNSPERSHALHVWERMQRNGVTKREELG